MGVDAYANNPENVDIPVNETVLRLKCGHAYHGMCVVMALRTSPKCPLCRDVPNAVFEDQEIELAHPIEIVVNVEDILRAEQSLNILDTIRSSNPNVQRARAQFNKEKRSFIHFSQQLEQKRREQLQKTLVEFRKEHRDTFDRKRRHLQKKLNKVKEIEKLAIREKYSAEETANALSEAAFSYKVENNIHVEPLRKSFWTR